MSSSKGQLPPRSPEVTVQEIELKQEVITPPRETTPSPDFNFDEDMEQQEEPPAVQNPEFLLQTTNVPKSTPRIGTGGLPPPPLTLTPSSISGQCGCNSSTGCTNPFCERRSIYNQPSVYQYWHSRPGQRPAAPVLPSEVQLSQYGNSALQGCAPPRSYFQIQQAVFEPSVGAHPQYLTVQTAPPSVMNGEIMMAQAVGPGPMIRIEPPLPPSGQAQAGFVANSQPRRTMISHPPQGSYPSVTPPASAVFQPMPPPRPPPLVQPSPICQAPLRPGYPAVRCECQKLKLSPYITWDKACERVKKIGLVATQREIDNFSAVITVGNQFLQQQRQRSNQPNQANRPQ